MLGEGKSLLAASIAMLLIGATATASPSEPHSLVPGNFDSGHTVSVHELELMREAAGGALLAFGQLESVSADESQLKILGQDLHVLAGAQALEGLHKI